MRRLVAPLLLSSLCGCYLFSDEPKARKQPGSEAGEQPETPEANAKPEPPKPEGEASDCPAFLTGTETKAADAPVETKPSGRKAKAPKAPKEKPPQDDKVVFAFRLTEAERAQIHKAAGPAKASRFVRALVTAASRGDVKAVTDIVATVQTS